MFIESITVSRCLGIEESLKFLFKETLKEVNNHSKTVIEAYSLIFDAKFGAESDLLEFFNVHIAGQPLVEIVLWQSDQNILLDCRWLKKTQLTLVRDLRQPKLIYVNGKHLNIASFHQAIASLGFISIDGFHLHRLLNEEIIRLSHFTGEDLWNLILQVNECEGLIEVIEKRHKNRQYLKSRFEGHVKEIEEVLPAKEQLQLDIRSHIKISKRFYAIMKIVSLRKVQVLRSQLNVINNELSDLEVKIDLKAHKMFDYKTERMKNEFKERSRLGLIDLIQNERHHLLELIASAQLSETSSFIPPGSFDSHSQQMVYLQSSILDKLTAFETFVDEFSVFDLFASWAELRVFHWKLSLKKTQDPLSWNSKLQNFKKELEYDKLKLKEASQEVHECEQEIKSHKESMTTIPEHADLISYFTDHNQKQFDVSKQILILRSDIYGHEKEILQLNIDINEISLMGELDFSIIESLKTLETFLAADLSSIQHEYLGPVFNYLLANTEFDYKLRAQLSTVVNIILFTKGSAARKFHRKLTNSGISIAYVFLGLDELTLPSSLPVPEELTGRVTTAESLVDETVAFKNVLKLLLRETVLIEGVGSSSSPMESFLKYTIYSRSGIITQSKGCLEFKSAISDVRKMKGISYIDMLQKVHLKVKKYAVCKSKINRSTHLEKNLQNVLKNNEKSFQKTLDAICKSSLVTCQLLNLHEMKAKFQKRFLSKSALVQAMVKASDEIQEGVEACNEDEIKESMRQLEMKLFEKEHRTVELEMKLNCHIKELKNSITRLQTQEEVFLSLLESQNDASKRLAFYKEKLALYNDELTKNRDELEVPSRSAMVDNNLRLDLTDVRCLIYKENSEKDVILRTIRSKMEIIDRYVNNNHDDLYDEYCDKSSEEISSKLLACYEELRKSKSVLGHEMISNEQYGHLKDLLKKVQSYSESPVRIVSRNKITSKAFPLMNKIIVMKLKDAVYNYQTTFSCVMSNFTHESNLFFFTRSLFDSIKHDNFNWECFDMGRLKAMDFVIQWKKGRKNDIGSASLRKIKGLLLIIHLISYLSIFKFIIIDETIFDNMDRALVQNLRKFLEAVSGSVQIILLKKQPDEIECELMDISM